MSFDLAVWNTANRLTVEEGGVLYGELWESNQDGVVPTPAVNAFYMELTAKHPEIDTIPEEQIDDLDLCPWSVALDRSPGHVIMSCVWSKAEYVERLVRELAHKHGLTMYDPQSGRVYHPDD
jgi:hypothetical protein